MNFLLDTCTFLWLCDRTEHLSAEARGILEDSGNTLVLSQVSSLEIQLKYSRGKLPLTVPPDVFVAEGLRAHGVSYLRLADEHIWATGKLPLIHNDPFDRLLIAQAIYEGMLIVTPDPWIQRYPARTEW